MPGLSNAQKLATLKKVKLFTGVSDHDLQVMVDYARSLAYERDSFVFFEGEPASMLYIVHQGRVKVFRTSEGGQDAILQIATVGDLMGGIAALGRDQVYPATAQALEDSLILAVPAEEFEQLVRRLPDVAWATIRFLRGRLFEAQEQVRTMAAERVERRVARRLLRLMDQVGKPTSEGVILDLPLSRQDLAAMTGATMETISRLISRWTRDRILAAGREQITILSPQSLIAIAEDLPSTPPRS